MFCRFSFFCVMKKIPWFTFIEVLIAIVVFSIGVLAVLWLVTRNLKTMDHNDTYLEATIFAKEWLELTYNLRDSNLEKYLPWNCILADNIFDGSEFSIQEGDGELQWICEWYFWSMWSIVISYPESQDRHIYAKILQTTWDFDSLFSGALLYQNSWNIGNLNFVWYSNQPWWTPTQFARYVSFKSIISNENNIEKSALDSDKILKIESHVLWKRWNSTWEVVLESFIWNY